jgi:hypothetical protein
MIDPGRARPEGVPLDEPKQELRNEANSVLCFQYKLKTKANPQPAHGRLQPRAAPGSMFIDRRDATKCYVM